MFVYFTLWYNLSMLFWVGQNYNSGTLNGGRFIQKFVIFDQLSAVLFFESEI